jgi:uncharacterized protein
MTKAAAACRRLSAYCAKLCLGLALYAGCAMGGESDGNDPSRSYSQDVTGGGESDASLRTQCIDGGSAEACLQEGYRLTHQQEADGDPWGAFAFFVRACEAGHGLGCLEAARLRLLKGSEMKDCEIGMELLESGCALHDIEACAYLGTFLVNKDCGDLDFDRGLELLRRTCEAEHAWSCGVVGFIYTGGRRTDIDQGIRYLRTGCNLGDGLACYNMGVLFHEGLLLQHDAHRAASLFQRACSHGHQRSCTLLERGAINLPKHDSGMFR